MNHYISILVIDRLLFRKKKTTNMMSDDDNLNVDFFFVILSLSTHVWVLSNSTWQRPWRLKEEFVYRNAVRFQAVLISKMVKMVCCHWDSVYRNHFLVTNQYYDQPKACTYDHCQKLNNRAYGFGQIVCSNY